MLAGFHRIRYYDGLLASSKRAENVARARIGAGKQCRWHIEAKRLGSPAAPACAAAKWPVEHSYE